MGAGLERLECSIVQCDNQGTVAVVNSGYSKIP